MDLELKQFCPYQARENPLKFILWLVFILLMLWLLLSGCASGTPAPENGNDDSDRGTDDAADARDAGKKVRSTSTQTETDRATQTESTCVDKATQIDPEWNDQLLPYMQDRLGGLERQMQQLIDCCHEGHKMKRSQACGTEDSGVAVQRARIAELQQQLEDCRAHGASLESQLEARDAPTIRATEMKGTQTEGVAQNAQNRIAELNEKLEKSQNRIAELDEKLTKSEFRHGYRSRRDPERIEEAEQRAKDAEQRAKDAEAAQKAAEKEQLQGKHKQASSQSEQESAARVSALKEVEVLEKRLQQAEDDKQAAMAIAEAKAEKEAAARQQAEMRLLEVQKAQTAHGANVKALQLAKRNVTELNNQLQAKKEQARVQERNVERLKQEATSLKKQQSDVVAKQSEVAAKQRTEYEAEVAVKIRTLEKERDEAARKQRDAESQLEANTCAYSVKEQAVQKELDGALRKQQEAEKQAAGHSALTERLENAERLAADLQKQLEDADKRKSVDAEAAQTVQTANQQIEAAVRKQSEAEAARDDANRTSESAMLGHQLLAAERDVLLQQVAMLESQRQQAFDANRNAELQYNALQTELSNASQRAETAEAQNNELRGQAEARIGDLERQHDDAIAQIEQLRQELFRAHAGWEDMSNQVKRHLSTEAELNDKLEECEKARRQQYAAVPELLMQSVEDSMTGTPIASDTQPGQSACENGGMDVEGHSPVPQDPPSGPPQAPPEEPWSIDPALASSLQCVGCGGGIPESNGYCSFCPPCETPGCTGREVWGKCLLCNAERPVPTVCSNQDCGKIGKFNNAENLCPDCERCPNCQSVSHNGHCIYCCSMCGSPKGLSPHCTACEEYRREYPELISGDLVLTCPECDKYPATENGACHECQICQVVGCGTRMQNGICPNMCDMHEHLNMETGKCDECESAKKPKLCPHCEVELVVKNDACLRCQECDVCGERKVAGSCSNSCDFHMQHFVDGECPKCKALDESEEDESRPKHLPDYDKMLGSFSSVAPIAPLTTKKWTPVMPPKPGSAPPNATAPSSGPISLHSKAQLESESLCPKCGVALIATNCWQPDCGACIRCKGLLDDGVCRNDGCGVPDSSLMARIRADAIDKDAFDKKKAERAQQDEDEEAAMQFQAQLGSQEPERPRRFLKPRRTQQRRRQQPVQMQRPLQMQEAPQTQQPLRMEQRAEMQHEPMQMDERAQGDFEFRAGQQQNFGQEPKDQDMPDEFKLG
ncbi:hypothetical protein EJ03DRAFT_333095 [Teratosphaeria nubilosa]|uniref:Uncharacterized protein n=1 Tax=Teratosphaeria nubilosa TaxID=161662 RepID=A0A6G1LP73_9PEZI|nr:hypothetical protein EJ03DRAFT_333095 [Teratosphaeria nubilosa]